MFVRITSNLARTWTLSKFCFSSLPPLMSASCTQCVAILYNTVGGESFSERTSGPSSKNALHAQVWHKNAVITGRAFVANDDRPARDVHLDTSINGQNHVLALRIAYKSWLVSAWRCYLSDASTNESFMINNYLGWALRLRRSARLLFLSKTSTVCAFRLRSPAPATPSRGRVSTFVVQR